MPKSKSKKKKTLVVFDTNIFRGKWWLGNDVHWAEYKKCVEMLELETFLPDAVFFEITDRVICLYLSMIEDIEKNIRKIRDKANQLNSEFMTSSVHNVQPDKKLSKVISSCDGIQREWTSRPVAEDVVSESLLSLLGSYKRVKTEVSHELLLSRLFSRKKPFKEKDTDKGYRDALIWNCVLELARKNSKATIVFVTENRKDFSSDEDENLLDESFLNDLDSEGIDRNRIKYIRSLTLFNQGYFVAKAIPVDKWLEDFEKSNEESFDEYLTFDISPIQQLLLDEIEYVLDFSEFHGTDYGDIDFTYFGELENLSVTAVKKFDKNLEIVIVRFSVEFALNFSSEVQPAYWYTEDNSEFWIEMHLNDHYVLMEGSGFLDATVRMLYNSESGKIEKYSIDEASFRSI